MASAVHLSDLNSSEVGKKSHALWKRSHAACFKLLALTKRAQLSPVEAEAALTVILKPPQNTHNSESEESQ